MGRLDAIGWLEQNNEDFLVFIVLDIIPGSAVWSGIDAGDPMDGTVIQPVIYSPASPFTVAVGIGIWNSNFRQEFGRRDAGKRDIILDPHLLKPTGIHVSAEDAIPERSISGGGNLD